MARSFWRLSALAIVAALAMASAGLAQPTAPAANPDVDPAAISALEKMGAYLRTLKVFRVDTRTTRDEVLDDGQKIQMNGKAALLIRRPDGMRASVESDLQDRMYFYDGKNFTLYAKRLGFYATASAPPTLAQLADVLDTKYDIEIPLADLFTWGTEQAHADKITSAVDVGPSEVDGTSCEHYAFRQEGLDWQVWLQQGSNPLPRKLVLTTTDDEARPDYSSTIIWDSRPPTTTPRSRSIRRATRRRSSSRPTRPESRRSAMKLKYVPFRATLAVLVSVLAAGPSRPAPGAAAARARA